MLLLVRGGEPEGDEEEEAIGEVDVGEGDLAVSVGVKELPSLGANEDSGIVGLAGVVAWRCNRKRQFRRHLAAYLAFSKDI